MKDVVPSIERDESDENGEAPLEIETGQNRFHSLFRKFHKSLIGLIHVKFGPGPPCPDDVAQQVFAKLLEIDQIREIKDLEAYAWTIAANIVRAEKRAQRVRAAYLEDRISGPLGSEHDAFDPERILRAKEEIEIIADTLQAMPARRRAIFLAARFEGLTPEQAGKREGVSRTSAVRHIAIATSLIVKALTAPKIDANDEADR